VWAEEGGGQVGCIWGSVGRGWERKRQGRRFSGMRKGKRAFAK